LDETVDLEELRLISPKPWRREDLEPKCGACGAQVVQPVTAFHNRSRQEPLHARRILNSRSSRSPDARTTVLITGESGTGKELGSRARSITTAPARDRPLIGSTARRSGDVDR